VVISPYFLPKIFAKAVILSIDKYHYVDHLFLLISKLPTEHTASVLAKEE
jgi:hypothetical protein